MDQYGESVIPIVGEGLVELVESGKADSEEADRIITRLLAPHLHRQIDSIVLGCTHYPFLAPVLRRRLPGVEIFDGRLGTCMQLKNLLEKNNLRSDATPGTTDYLTSGDESTIALMKRLMQSLD